MHQSERGRPSMAAGRRFGAIGPLAALSRMPQFFAHE
jgi:hypothetical protein